mmetsp:Transcript_12102/g.18576  ORF Transcript_12102/g.18576 Transcript_12102/m.18576 type:complete len:225 (-) Transcript_12102:171-845(-)|eukprot:CAMPEP_0178921838 /NCGR_PEP_ID=MMETSP0786-20121207/15791_1 /TAXON_ID=186022 /ORGANISM="Thalassionema frauenfeldii, Strain CCMP 1798" /LENGTH=224 /DNA_ID=CAMNT_0020596077 /DNA_START=36 /DNA_END=710 /DNA_ORIENTATION=-
MTMMISRASSCWLLFLFTLFINALLGANAFVVVPPKPAKNAATSLKSTVSANSGPYTRRNYYDGLSYGYEMPGRMRGYEQGFGTEFRYPRYRSYYNDGYYPRGNYYGRSRYYNDYDGDYYNGRWNNDYYNGARRYPRARYPSQDRYHGSSYYGNAWDERYGRSGRRFYDFDDSYYDRRRQYDYDDDYYYGSYDDYDDYDDYGGDYWYNRNRYGGRRYGRGYGRW